ncbi:inositol 1,4,5-triphosphate receptor associated 1 [Trichosurus vulpecula]|uniref:inositol 1,4,5-triphosphate receptor associated 1 n=1 Tax=Trichosurus vulpecula TaxID=9337 RepID=UPI00186B2D88|nr:inositol 1,4,5-triphosphate receptor associated 1 [Trichosurus vulpecula]
MGKELICAFGISPVFGSPASQCSSPRADRRPRGLAVHGLVSQPSSPEEAIMPNLPGDEEQPGEPQPALSPAVEGPPAEETVCGAPSIVLPGDEDAVTPDVENDKNLVSRPRSPRHQLSNRHMKASLTSLTSVDNAGHIIHLVNDQLPDIKISEEDKKRNLELLEEAKKVSERFLTRRGRKSRSSLPDSPSAISPNLSPGASPAGSRSNSLSSPPSPSSGSEVCAAPLPGPGSPLQKGDEPSFHLDLPNATKGLTDRKQNDQRKVSQGRLAPRSPSVEKSKETLSEQKENFDPLKHVENSTPKVLASGSGGGKMSLNSPTGAGEKDPGKQLLKKPKESDPLLKSHLQGPGPTPQGPQGKGPAWEPPNSKTPSKADLKPSGFRPPLQRGVSWDSSPMEPGPKDKVIAKLAAAEEEKRFPSKVGNKLPKSSGFKDFQIQVQPVRMQKLTKLREEHILMRSQNLVGLKLPDLSEAVEQERGHPSELSPGIEEEESKSVCDVMPNISDVLLHKLRVHKALPGSAPPLTEKEVENVFVQLSLAFRNDSYTLESRISQAERERNLTEENTEKELNNFKASITSSASIWQPCEHRETYEKLLEDIAVLHRLAARLSSRAEMVGAVRQEKRMSKAAEVMMQYVENLKRTYEKDHAELMEFKKLANQNSSRSYGPSEDGVPRATRSMSLTLGKNMPRRRVSVAVVPKFNALNIPGQSPSTSPIPSLPALAESPNGKGNPSASLASPALLENGKSNGDQDCEGPAPSAPPALTQSALEEISQEVKARIEEEAYNKGYQEGLKKTKELQELKEDEEEKTSESLEGPEGEDEEKELKSSKLEALIHFLQILYPKMCQHWNVIWMVAAAILVFTVVLGLYNSYHSCTELSEGASGKATCSASQRDSWWNSGLQQEQPTEQ